MHKSYFKSRKELFYTLLLVDLRHEIQQNDLDFMEFLNSNYCPFIIIFTKSDKLKVIDLDKRLETLKRQLSDYWEDFPKMIITSSKNKKGIDEIILIDCVASLYGRNNLTNIIKKITKEITTNNKS